MRFLKYTQLILPHDKIGVLYWSKFDSPNAYDYLALDYQIKGIHGFGSMFLLLNDFSSLKGKMESDFNEWVKSATGAPQISSLELIDTTDTLKRIY